MSRCRHSSNPSRAFDSWHRGGSHRFLNLQHRRIAPFQLSAQQGFCLQIPCPSEPTASSGSLPTSLLAPQAAQQLSLLRSLKPYHTSCPFHRRPSKGRLRRALPARDGAIPATLAQSVYRAACSRSSHRCQAVSLQQQTLQTPTPRTFKGLAYLNNPQQHASLLSTQQRTTPLQGSFPSWWPPSTCFRSPPRQPTSNFAFVNSGSSVPLFLVQRGQLTFNWFTDPVVRRKASCASKQIETMVQILRPATQSRRPCPWCRWLKLGTTNHLKAPRLA